MCCVMPPASPAATSVARIASRSDVFPWSTCPIIVTTGARVTASSSPPSASPRSSICSTSTATFSTWCSNSPATRVAVSWSSAWLMVAIIPMSRSFFSTSPP
jgi:hypothetical protein